MPLERIHAFRHEVREDDAVGQGRVFQRGAVGVGDRLHQQADHVVAAGEKLFKQLPGGQVGLVGKLHVAGRIEERVHGFGRDLEPVGQQSREVLSVERGR